MRESIVDKYYLFTYLDLYIAFLFIKYFLENMIGMTIGCEINDCFVELSWLSEVQNGSLVPT